jgi:hypothetical protein
MDLRIQVLSLGCGVCYNTFCLVRLLPAESYCSWILLAKVGDRPAEKQRQQPYKEGGHRWDKVDNLAAP